MVMVANPRGLLVAESIIFPFNIPWLKDKKENKHVVMLSRTIFFMALV
jgi:hypothetical protein